MGGGWGGGNQDFSGGLSVQSSFHNTKMVFVFVSVSQKCSGDFSGGCIICDIP